MMYQAKVFHAQTGAVIKDLEVEMNKWLEANPDIVIHAMTSMAESHLSLYVVTILYEKRKKASVTSLDDCLPPYD
ncbi:MAG: hypothetical protein JSS66_06265 [Armatimonadetes bacterium]|nr:hypothetical protein [Armatimonadota bacterium]